MRDTPWWWTHYWKCVAVTFVLLALAFVGIHSRNPWFGGGGFLLAFIAVVVTDWAYHDAMWLDAMTKPLGEDATDA